MYKRLIFTDLKSLHANVTMYDPALYALSVTYTTTAAASRTIAVYEMRRALMSSHEFLYAISVIAQK